MGQCRGRTSYLRHASFCCLGVSSSVNPFEVVAPPGSSQRSPSCCSSHVQCCIRTYLLHAKPNPVAGEFSLYKHRCPLMRLCLGCGGTTHSRSCTSHMTGSMACSLGPRCGPTQRLPQTAQGWRTTPWPCSRSSGKHARVLVWLLACEHRSMPRTQQPLPFFFSSHATPRTTVMQHSC